MSRLPSLTFALLFALTSACSDDESTPTDAGQDARRDGSSGCMMADCKNMPQPRVSCPAATVAEFNCVRTFDQKCTWGQERCVPGLDGGTAGDGSVTTPDGPSAPDGPPDDASADAPAD